MTAQRPPSASRSGKTSRKAASWSSSRLTAMRSAWQVRVAGEGRGLEGRLGGVNLHAPRSRLRDALLGRAREITGVAEAAGAGVLLEPLRDALVVALLAEVAQDVAQLGDVEPADELESGRLAARGIHPHVDRARP